eukprot:TRINITY_DN22785_c0_g1_i1.p1 TRINITY_DN22785_c0_g1~~TRINITY_DN22785_c0_g1_i1.p1  ORF type:complete len:318 (+),score=62.29 TRINITY_DN22785_c0_g1_i1:108-1061(+)
MSSSSSTCKMPALRQSANKRSALRLSALAAVCLTKSASAQLKGACEDVTGMDVNPSCWKQIEYATNVGIKEHKESYPAGTSSLADFQCALYLKGKIDPATGASSGPENYGCTLPPCARLSPSMSSGDGSTAYNEVFTDSTPDWCTPQAEQHNEEIAEGHIAAPAPSAPASTSGVDQASVPEQKDGFQVGDSVKWIGSDQDVPAGSIGQVVGFNDDGVNVQFDHGVFNFLPSELNVVTQAEAEAYKSKEASYSMYTTWGLVLLATGCITAGSAFWMYRNQKKTTRGLASPREFTASESEDSGSEEPDNSRKSSQLAVV